MTTNEITAATRAGCVRVTDHADEEMAADRLTLDAVVFSVTNGEIIEQYPRDVPYPSCLVFGQTPDGLAGTAFGRITQVVDGQY